SRQAPGCELVRCDRVGGAAADVLGENACGDSRRLGTLRTPGEVTTGPGDDPTPRPGPRQTLGAWAMTTSGPQRTGQSRTGNRLYAPDIAYPRKWDVPRLRQMSEDELRTQLAKTIEMEARAARPFPANTWRKERLIVERELKRRKKDSS